MSNTEKLIYFVSEESIYYQGTIDEFNKLLEELKSCGYTDFEVIDVSKNPEKAEEYKVDVLPTLVIGGKRFLGKLDIQKIKSYLKETPK